MTMKEGTDTDWSSWNCYLLLNFTFLPDSLNLIIISFFLKVHLIWCSWITTISTTSHFLSLSFCFLFFFRDLVYTI
ncbi:hypothetical protein F4809DRAFT_620586 [Biscogniauxia mediterranea]|nr:hypothetical protein F4809DRAFT_620586 [Biscogniauxia mediterranea]